MYTYITKLSYYIYVILCVCIEERADYAELDLAAPVPGLRGPVTGVVGPIPLLRLRISEGLTRA